MAKKIFGAFIILTVLIGAFFDFPLPANFKFQNYEKVNAQTVEEVAAGAKVLVLNYHQVANTFNALAIPVNDFDAQMRFLSENGYVTITPDELAGGFSGEVNLPEKPVLITFDDGYTDNYTNAFPILKKYGMRATIFVIAGFVGQPRYMTWDQLREMEQNGISIESHTMNHIALEELPDDEIRNELLNSKNTIEQNLNNKVEFLAYPTGTYNLHIASIAREVGYKGAYTVKYGVDDLGSNMYALERVPIFQTENTMKSFYERTEYRQNFEEFGWIKK